MGVFGGLWLWVKIASGWFEHFKSCMLTLKVLRLFCISLFYFECDHFDCDILVMRLY